MKRLWVAIALIALLAPIALTAGCGDDDDDDSTGPHSDDDDDDNDDTTNDDDTPDDPTLDMAGVFVSPAYHYADTDAQIAKLVRTVRSFGPTTLIWRWTLLYNRVVYPSESFDELGGIASEDLLEALLDEADAQGMSVFLGLSAGRRPAEQFDDPTGPEAQRVERLIDELAARYGAHASLAGFYIPYEFIGPPTQDETLLLTRIANRAHAALPGAGVLISVHYRGPAQHNYLTTLLRDFDYHLRSQNDIDDQAERTRWANRTVAALAPTGVDLVLVKTMMGNYRNDLAEAELDIEAFVGEVDVQSAPFEVGAQIDLYDAMNAAGRMQPVLGPASASRIDAQAALAADWELPAFGFSWDHYVNADGHVVPPRTGADPVLAKKAQVIEQHLRSRGLRDGNVVTVIDGQLPLDMFGNLWQEDACWITGLYLGAESFRCAVTASEQACALADQLADTLHEMANVTPLPGEVVRNFTRYLITQTNPVSPGSSTIKRWHKHPDKEVYWVGDISVDQLSGYFYGLAVYYDLVADAQQRRQIEQDVSRIMGLILDNGLRAREFNGQNATYGNLRAAPELGTTWLAMAWRITGESRFRDAFDMLIEKENMHWKLIVYHWVMHAVLQKYGGQHFQDTGLYHLYTYAPTDPAVFRELIWGLEYVYQGSFTWGNAMADFTHQAHTPDSAGAARSLHDHYMYNPAYLDNGVWAAQVNQSFAGGYHPMEYRSFDEWDWTVAPTSTKNPRGGPNHRYPGVAYLVTYWEGRWHGWIP